MSYDCSCDYDPPEFCHVELRTARKEHKCCECSGRIIKGEKYEYTRGKWEGFLSSFKTCERCYDIRTWVKNNVPCLCWAYGNMIDDCKEAVIEANHRAPHEVVGLYFGFLRRVVLRDRINSQRKGVMTDETTIDLPICPSVNRTRRVDWPGTTATRAWKQSADKMLMVQGWKRRTHKGRVAVTIVLSDDLVRADPDNICKAAMDYLRRVEIIEDDSPRHIRELHVIWGLAPEGMRITVRSIV